MKNESMIIDHSEGDHIRELAAGGTLAYTPRLIPSRGDQHPLNSNILSEGSGRIKSRRRRMSKIPSATAIHTGH